MVMWLFIFILHTCFFLGGIFYVKGIRLDIFCNYNLFSFFQNGLLNAVPFLCKSVGTLFAAFVSDKMLEKKITSHGTTRKIMEFLCKHTVQYTVCKLNSEEVYTRFCFLVGLVPTAVLVIVVSYLTCRSRMLAVALLCLAVGFTGFGRCGYMANMVDIAPR